MRHNIKWISLNDNTQPISSYYYKRQIFIRPYYYFISIPIKRQRSEMLIDIVRDNIIPRYIAREKYRFLSSLFIPELISPFFFKIAFVRLISSRSFYYFTNITKHVPMVRDCWRCSTNAKLSRWNIKMTDDEMPRALLSFSLWKKFSHYYFCFVLMLKKVKKKRWIKNKWILIIKYHVVAY